MLVLVDIINLFPNEMTIISEKTIFEERSSSSRNTENRALPA